MTQTWMWITIVVVGVLTFLIRLSFIAFIGNMQIPALVQQALRFVPIAALSALIAPTLLYVNGSLAMSLDNSRLLSGILAIVVAWRTKNILLTIVCGMACLIVLQAIALMR